jgi:hypothetical protein
MLPSSSCQRKGGVDPYFGSFFLLLMSRYRFKQTVIVSARVTVGTLRLTMKHAVLVLSVFAAIFGTLIVSIRTGLRLPRPGDPPLVTDTGR